MNGKSLNQIENELNSKRISENIKRNNLILKEAQMKEDARKDYIERNRMNERLSQITYNQNLSSGGRIKYNSYISIIDTIWIYPEEDVEFALNSTTFSYNRNNDDLIFDDLDTLVAVYEQIYFRTAVTQPIGNEGYSLGVGTILKDLNKVINFKLIDGSLIVKWTLSEQITSQSSIPVGGNSPDNTIGYLTIFTDWNPSNTPPSIYVDKVLVESNGVIF